MKGLKIEFHWKKKKLLSDTFVKVARIGNAAWVWKKSGALETWHESLHLSVFFTFGRRNAYISKYSIQELCRKWAL